MGVLVRIFAFLVWSALCGSHGRKTPVFPLSQMSDRGRESRPDGVPTGLAGLTRQGLALAFGEKPTSPTQAALGDRTEPGALWPLQTLSVPQPLGASMVLSDLPVPCAFQLLGGFCFSKGTLWGACGAQSQRGRCVSPPRCAGGFHSKGDLTVPGQEEPVSLWLCCVSGNNPRGLMDWT